MKQIQSIKRFRPPVLLTILLGLFASACSSFDNLSLDSINVFKDPSPIYCPTVSILGNAERITIFKEGSGRDIIDITTEARIDDFIAKCSNQFDGETSTGQVLVDLSVSYTASRGPANKEGTYTLPYFVSILDKNKNVLNKVTFQIKSVFDGNRYRVTGYDDIVTLAIPVAPPLTGRDFLIYIGFQLTPEQMKYNQLNG